MSIAFVILCILTIASAVTAMTLRNLVHCALAVSVTFAGLAGLFLLLDAQFIGFAQILVYVGAVAILIVFAVLLTRATQAPGESSFSTNWFRGVVVAGAVFGIVAGALYPSKVLNGQGSTATVSVRQIGDRLMSTYILPLEVLGLLLTAALIGAVIIALQDSEPKGRGPK